MRNRWIAVLDVPPVVLVLVLVYHQGRGYFDKYKPEITMLLAIWGTMYNDIFQTVPIE